MPTEITSETIAQFKSQLENHPVYEAVATLEDLQCFMEHHVYSVWDFMSLIKYLQSEIAPTRYPWYPQGDAQVRRFINELVLEEESDETEIPSVFSSHFELYLRAMQEIGANTTSIEAFISHLQKNGEINRENNAHSVIDTIDSALALPTVPTPSRNFTTQTFQFIRHGKPHEAAAALALGREHIIPCIFRAILKRFGVTADDAPIFHFYLNRHIHLDEDFHAPLSLQLLNGLCAGNETKIAESIAAAQTAVEARLAFWDGVLEAIQNRKN